MSVPVAIEHEVQAVKNLAAGIDSAVRIPHRVFSPPYKEIYVMDGNRLLSQGAVKLLKALIELEHAHIVAVACLQQSTVVSPEQQGQKKEWEEDVYFVSAATSDEAYSSFLRRNWSEYGQRTATHSMRSPWLIFAEIVCACSELGGWYMYSDKFAEITLLAFSDNPGVFIEKRLLSDFGIEKLADALRRDTFFGDPGNEYSKRQRAILRAAYLPRRDEPRPGNLR
jgi:hypothetical protein